MSTKDNGGPAFPCDVFDPEVNGPEQHEGMTLRDYFAAKALSGVMDLCRNDHPEAGESRSEGFARAAYIVADAMLKARAA